ncbi:MAG TPA: DUF222 domain-containing protein [Candidatus Dormibacteraeota bacterium]|jgi:hypothetical protein|nr:DUF222 domain-containing protein [Candidatus Dormibacteraeota bacterium]
MRSALTGTVVSPLHDALDAANKRLSSLSPAALGEELIDLRRLQDRLEATFAHALRRFDKSDAYAVEGSNSSVSWLRWHCHLSPNSAAERVGMARVLGDLPETDQALSTGSIGYQHAAHITRTAGQIGVEAVREVEPVLVKAAHRLDPKQFSMVTRHLRHCADPDGSLADANRRFDSRYLNLSESSDGDVFLEGMLDAEGGAVLRTALNALNPPLPDEKRNPSQRRADALVELARRGLDSGKLPEVGGERPHLTITTTREALAGVPGNPGGDLVDGVPVPSETVRRIACDASVTLVVLDGDSQPLDVGRAKRVVPTRLRKALVARDKGCRFPGCDRPANWTDSHHVRHWADGGETKLSNLVLLCRRHHRKVHEEGWRLVWEDEHRVVAIPPDPFGRRLVGLPAG